MAVMPGSVSTRRGKVSTASMGVVLLLVVAGFVGYWIVRSRTPRSWDVLLVTLDTTRADRLGCYGYQAADTPTIDRLSHKGVRYERCYTSAPLTMPAHCSLLTGLVPRRHGIHVNGEALSGEPVTLAELLKKRGYTTGAVVGAFVLDAQFGLARGFDQYDDDVAEGAETSQFHFAERNAERVTDAALAWWRQQRSTPRFLWVHYFDPHEPYAAPGYDPAFSYHTAYDAEITFVDRHLNRLLSEVEASERPTLVVLVGDHGESLGEHGEQTHGLFTYDATLHVPLVVRFPDGRSAGEFVSGPVGVVDVMPSILHWLGLPLPGDLDGMPLPQSDAVPNTSPAAPRPIFFENRFVARTYGWSPLSGIIVGDWKYIRAPRPEVYDLSQDPHERDNRFDPTDARSRELSERYEEVLADLTETHAPAATVSELNEPSLNKLRSLGYVGTSSPASGPAAESLSPAADPKDMLSVYRQLHLAINLIDQQQYLEALDLLVPILEDAAAERTNPRAVKLLSLVLTKEPAARPRGIACLQQVMERQPTEGADGFMLESLGYSLIEEHRYAEAVEPLRRLVKQDADNAAAYFQLGTVYHELGDAEESAAAYRHAIQRAEGEPPPDWLEEAQRQLKLFEGKTVQGVGN